MLALKVSQIGLDRDVRATETISRPINKSPLTIDVESSYAIEIKLEFLEVPDDER